MILSESIRTCYKICPFKCKTFLIKPYHKRTVWAKIEKEYLPRLSDLNVKLSKKIKELEKLETKNNTKEMSWHPQVGLQNNPYYKNTQEYNSQAKRAAKIARKIEDQLLQVRTFNKNVRTNKKQNKLIIHWDQLRAFREKYLWKYFIKKENLYGAKLANSHNLIAASISLAQNLYAKSKHMYQKYMSEITENNAKNSSKQWNKIIEKMKKELMPEKKKLKKKINKLTALKNKIEKNKKLEKSKTKENKNYEVGFKDAKDALKYMDDLSSIIFTFNSVVKVENARNLIIDTHLLNLKGEPSEKLKEQFAKQINRMPSTSSLFDVIFQAGNSLYRNVLFLRKTFKAEIGKIADTSKQQGFLDMSLDTLEKAETEILYKLKALSQVSKLPGFDKTKFPIHLLIKEDTSAADPIQKSYLHIAVLNHAAWLFSHYVVLDEDQGLSIYWSFIIRDPEPFMMLKELFEKSRKVNDKTDNAFTIKDCAKVGRDLKSQLKEVLKKNKDLSKSVDSVHFSHKRMILDGLVMVKKMIKEVGIVVKQLEEFKHNYSRKLTPHLVLEKAAKLSEYTNAINRYVKMDKGKLVVDWEMLKEVPKLALIIDANKQKKDTEKAIALVKNILNRNKKLNEKYVYEAKRSDIKLLDSLLNTVIVKLQKKNKKDLKRKLNKLYKIKK